ncbi:hypothetical protein [Herminiimonas sp. CN]|uniref:hypothetical protein n=1 Tax=Herminiimonas sp. CN TaxID=1349818 RepID=UPI0012DC74E6|nr:hypothetical protein [Herminiimonas sp. CN]
MSATNGIGWEVQQLTSGKGWSAVSPAYPSREDAHAVMRDMNADGIELRVYEALEIRK